MPTIREILQDLEKKIDATKYEDFVRGIVLEQAEADIREAIMEKLPKEKIIQSRPIGPDAEYECGKEEGYNLCLSEVKKAIRNV